MAYSAVWYFTQIPEKIIEILEEDLKQLDNNLKESAVGSKGNTINENLRISKNSWVPDYHWSVGLCWHFLQKANNENFLYNVIHFDGNSMQYTSYEQGEFYGWHRDTEISELLRPNKHSSNKRINEEKITLENQPIRKLSFTLQLSDPSDYIGGEMQLMDENGKLIALPKERGSAIIFDSRLSHRVRKVKSGHRKSLVGWAIGPRWK